MLQPIRTQYNAHFDIDQYQSFVQELQQVHPDGLCFRVAETPVFCSSMFTEKMISACEAIVDIIKKPNFKELTERSIPNGLQVQHENDHSHFIAFDFGVCINDAGEYEPMLIEMQGFPTLFAYEVLLDDVFQKHYPIVQDFTPYMGGYNRETYLSLLQKIILGSHKKEHVILLEVLPHEQKTRIDFYCTQDYLGIKPVCVTEIIKEGRGLFYMNNGEKTRIHRIYNRLIFDDLQKQPKHIQDAGAFLFDDIDVEWVPHPHWFYRISKFTLPFIEHPNVPETFFLNDIKEIPQNLEDFVLKPLFSFAGQGVVINVTQKDIDDVVDKENWILQRKVTYADFIPTPDVPAKAEIRIFYFWEDGVDRPVPTNNLARLSKGKMIGVRYNADKEWVGGSYALFQK